ncbi:hypothetical protein CYMTET_10083 [Cymbomonas tetramitiformis]|uniref:mitogen-activated protein kinase kinase n=1 Tax=Cymbomonas tetramitiformis TaxID=36881 RepID=A0AAE0GQ99_9CHLO|nr:hypothetical protein CYMTET_10083 [Cymbomonas tetramitiformis]
MARMDTVAGTQMWLGKFELAGALGAAEDEATTQQIERTCTRKWPHVLPVVGIMADLGIGALAVGTASWPYGNLSSLLKERRTVARRLGEPLLPEAAIAQLVYCTLHALLSCAAHPEELPGEVNLCPSTMMICMDGTIELALPIARMDMANAPVDQSSMFYMSPEQVRNDVQSIEPAWVWSLGITLMEAATGDYPFSAQNGIVSIMTEIMGAPPRLAPVWRGHLSAEFQQLVQDCTHHDPTERPTPLELLEHSFLRCHVSGGGDVETRDKSDAIRRLLHTTHRAAEWARVAGKAFLHYFFQLLGDEHSFRAVKHLLRDTSAASMERVAELADQPTSAARCKMPDAVLGEACIMRRLQETLVGRVHRHTLNEASTDDEELTKLHLTVLGALPIPFVNFQWK